MGGSTQNRYWNHPSQDQCNNVEHYKNDNHNNNQLSDYSFDLNNVKNTRNPQENQYPIVDLGASDQHIAHNIATLYEPKCDMDVISVVFTGTFELSSSCTVNDIQTKIEGNGSKLLFTYKWPERLLNGEKYHTTFTNLYQGLKCLK